MCDGAGIMAAVSDVEKGELKKISMDTYPLRSVKPTMRRSLLWGGCAWLVFSFLDVLALAALPQLQLSFGPIWFSWLGLLVLRGLIFGGYLLWLMGTHLTGGRGVRMGLGLLWGFQVGLAVCAWQALYLEPFRLTVTHLTLPAPQLHAAGPLRIVQVSDLHIEYTTRRERDVLAELEALAPDIIVLTGDYLNTSNLDDPQSRRDARALLAQLQAPYGVYAVSGNVDRHDIMQELFSGLSITVLDDDLIPVALPGDAPLYIAGVSTLVWERDAAALLLVMRGVPPEAYTVLLYHTPDLAYTAAELPVSLYLAGHTHGGQLRLPFYGAILTLSRYGKRFEQGLYTVDAMTLYVSRGLGMEGWLLPRARFLCPPELVVITLAP